MGLTRGHPGIAVRQDSAVNIVRVVLYYVLWMYLLMLIGRLILAWIQAYSRSWTPYWPAWLGSPR